MPGSGSAIRLLSGAKSDKGMQRSNNEDSISLIRQELAVLAIIADGMGGAVAGERASRIAVETVQKHLLSYPFETLSDLESIPDDVILDLIVEAVRHANENIIREAVQEPELQGMGTTLTLALARGREVVFAHVGDSRAYLIDGYDRSLVQITRDHSLVQALLDAGHISPQEAEHHAMRNVLYRALGQIPDLDVDLISGVALNPGDRILLCSDGLTLHVSAEEIRAVALADDDPERIAAKLVDLANQRGGRDNISVIVILAQPAEVLHRNTDLLTMDYEDEDPTLPLR
jgi:protein phosphatase